VPVELFHVDLTTDEQTDIQKLTTAFRNFANASENDRDDSCTEHLVLSFRTTDTEDEMARRFRKVKRLTTNRHGVRTQKILNCSNTAVRTYSLATTVRCTSWTASLHIQASKVFRFSNKRISENYLDLICIIYYIPSIHNNMSVQ